jgi:hypothetical protein
MQKALGRMSVDFLDAFFELLNSFKQPRDFIVPRCEYRYIRHLDILHKFPCIFHGQLRHDTSRNFLAIFSDLPNFGNYLFQAVKSRSGAVKLAGMKAFSVWYISHIRATAGGKAGCPVFLSPPLYFEVLVLRVNI